MRRFISFFGLVAFTAGVAAQQPIVSGETAASPVREIADTPTGTRWMLMRDVEHPEGPGRMVALKEPKSNAPSPAKPVVRAGGAVLVEEHSDRVDLQLLAEALGPAAVGDVVTLRLRMGGKSVRARVVDAGHAVLVAGTGEQP